MYCSGYGFLALMGGPFEKLMGNRARVEGGFFVAGLCLALAGSVFIGLHCAFSIITRIAWIIAKDFLVLYSGGLQIRQIGRMG